jgi:hypothetical protein
MLNLWIILKLEEYMEKLVEFSLHIVQEKYQGHLKLYQIYKNGNKY